MAGLGGPPPPPSYDQAANHDTLCIKCQTRMGAGAKFCGNCGNKREERRAFEQYVPAEADQGIQRAVQHAECVICYEPMHSEPSGVFTANGKRVCIHFIHHKCAESMINAGRKSCPICRTKCTGVKEVPSIISEPRKWFQVVDMNKDHRLSMLEVLHVLRAQLPIDFNELEQKLPDLFKKWDLDGSGTISEEELLRPNGGLLEYARETFKLHDRARAPPDIIQDKGKWFDFYDEDSSGTLDKTEVFRGIVQTFKLSEDLQRLEMIIETIEAVWGMFDVDGSGTIDRSEFLIPDTGLADTIIATLSARAGHGP